MFFFVKTKRMRERHREERRILTELEEEQLKIDIEKDSLKKMEKVNALVHKYNDLVKKKKGLADEGLKALHELDELVLKRRLGDGKKAGELGEIVKNRTKECGEIEKKLSELKEIINKKKKKVKR